MGYLLCVDKKLSNRENSQGAQADIARLAPLYTHIQIRGANRLK